MSLYTDLIDNFQSMSQAAATIGNAESRAAWAVLTAAQAEAMKAEQARIANIIALLSTNTNPGLSIESGGSLINEAVRALAVPVEDE